MGGVLQQFIVDPGAAAYHQGIGIGDRHGQLAAGDPRQVDGLDSFGLFEDLEPFAGKVVGDQDLHAPVPWWVTACRDVIPGIFHKQLN